jgi:single-strand DNA-binding protein
MNRFEIIGNLGRAPEIRYTPAGIAVASLNIGTTRHFKDSAGNRQEQTTWLRVTVFGKSAENAEKYLDKGNKIYAAGRIENDEWEKDGVKHYGHSFIAQEIEYLSPSSKGGTPPDDDDIPHEYSTAGTAR